MRLKEILAELGHSAWIYREGSAREVYVLETTAKFLDVDFDPDILKFDDERIAYVRGYFDAEGGLPQSPDARFYIQFTQKDYDELEKVKIILDDMGIECGEMHNPSVEVDPNYWRFYVRAKSHEDFAEKIGSWHPRKAGILERMKI